MRVLWVLFVFVIVATISVPTAQAGPVTFIYLSLGHSLGLDSETTFTTTSGTLTDTSSADDLAWSFTGTLETSFSPDGSGGFGSANPVTIKLTDLSITCRDPRSCGSGQVFFDVEWAENGITDAAWTLSVDGTGPPLGNYSSYSNSMNLGLSGLGISYSQSLSLLSPYSYETSGSSPGGNGSFGNNSFGNGNNSMVFFDLNGSILVDGNSVASNSSLSLPDSIELDLTDLNQQTGPSSSVPEPATIALIAGAFATLAARRYRKTR